MCVSKVSDVTKYKTLEDAEKLEILYMFLLPFIFALSIILLIVWKYCSNFFRAPDRTRTYTL